MEIKHWNYAKEDRYGGTYAVDIARNCIMVSEKIWKDISYLYIKTNKEVCIDENNKKLLLVGIINRE